MPNGATPPCPSLTESLPLCHFPSLLRKRDNSGYFLTQGHQVSATLGKQGCHEDWAASMLNMYLGPHSSHARYLVGGSDYESSHATRFDDSIGFPVGLPSPSIFPMTLPQGSLSSVGAFMKKSLIVNNGFEFSFIYI